MADGTHDKVKLNVRVPPDKKQEWKDALDEGETVPVTGWWKSSPGMA